MPDRYPIGEQNFANIRNNDLLYVDKTSYIHHLVASGSSYYFLSRPRRFGKSLLISTLEEYFKGNRQLFKGLAIDKLQPEPWKSHPVLHLDFNATGYESKSDLRQMLELNLSRWESIYGKTENAENLATRFLCVINKAYEKTGAGAVILIDEYDKPLLDAIDDKDLLEANRTTLKSFYGVMKSAQGSLRFVMLTGVGKIAQLNVFSGLNNIRDISMSEDYSGICGITKAELHRDLAHGVELLARHNGMTPGEAYDKLKKFYDGYHFANDMLDIYNPFSLLSALADRNISSYWFRTGTPTHLVKALRNADEPIADFDGFQCGAETLMDGNVLGTNLVSILYYSGYLTLKGYDREFGLYTLGYPNEEVERGFISSLIPMITTLKSQQTDSLIKDLTLCIREGRLDDFFDCLKTFFAGVPNDMIGRNEAHYQDIVYCVCKLLGFYVQAEYKTSHGRIDMILATKDAIYIMEFKRGASADAALDQIKKKGYTLPFKRDGRPIIPVGVNFSDETHNIDDWKVGMGE